LKSNENGLPGMSPPGTASPPSTASWKPAGSPLPVRQTAAPAGPPPAGNVRAPSAPRERKPALAALGLLLVLVGVLASVYLQQQAGNRVGVVEITQRVPAGQSITSSSISEVMVAADPGISYVKWSQTSQLSQYTAATDLVPGTLLVGQMLTTATSLPAGSQIVPLALKDGQYPDGIQVGDVVSAYYVSNKNDALTGQQFTADGYTTPSIVADVPVYAVSSSGTSGAIDISLIAGQTSVAALTQAASGGNLVLVFDKHTSD
jgi:hypothetical protein